jgi:glycosyltransferase involved in cell wall biosynthesis
LDRLRCLLISALPPGDPESGDAQYTRDLLAAPPEEVEYVPYQDALASGELEEGSSWRRGGRRPSDLGAAVAASERLALNAGRRRGWLLPDPVRWWRINGSFDLVHIHCMPTHLTGVVPPVVLTDSAGTFWYWTRVHGVGEAQTWSKLGRERRLATALGYHHPSARPDAAAAALYFVDSGIRFARRVGAPANNLAFCPAGVPDPTVGREPSAGRPLTLAFVAHNFAIKGGPDALEIFRRVRLERPDVRMIVAGSSDRDPGIDGLEWLGPKTRQELYDEVYPRADVFVYPTRFDTAALVAEEAMANGMPVVAPAALCMPDIVRDGETGFLFPEDDIDAATERTLRLLRSPDLLVSMSESARADFDLRFSVSVRNSVLSDAYRRAYRRKGEIR